MKIAFLGLGIMGSRMAERLIRAGFELTVWNRTPGRGEGLKKLGAKEAASPKEAAAGADVAITMLADPASVEQVALSKNGLLEGLKKGSLYINDGRGLLQSSKFKERLRLRTSTPYDSRSPSLIASLILLAFPSKVCYISPPN